MRVTSRVLRRLPAVAAVALLAGLTAGCMTPTAYAPATGQGFSRQGYSEHQIEADRWAVTFAGNSLTGKDTVEKYLLFRAAELTLQQGGDYFVMANRDTDQQTRTYTTPGFGGGFGGYGGLGGGYWGPSWRFYGHYGRGFGWRHWDPFWGDPWGNDFDVQTVQKYEATAEIVIGHGPKPADIHAFDARDVIDHLRPSIATPR